MLSIISSVLVIGLSAAGQVAMKYVFVENVARDWSLRRDGYIIAGRLNSRGEFTETFRLVHTAHIGGGVQIGPVLNFSLVEGTPVYELRSGVLVPGTFDKDGYFVPDVGGKIIKFSEYKYSPDGPKIWNLPGEYMTQTEAKKYRDWQAIPRPIVMPHGFDFSTGPKAKSK
jgi:hypothetical protein